MPSVPASADSQFARTRHTLRRVSPRVRPAPAGQVPTTLEAVDAEAGLPALAVPRPPRSMAPRSSGRPGAEREGHVDGVADGVQER